MYYLFINLIIYFFYIILIIKFIILFFLNRHLYNKKLTGLIPPELGNLSNLFVL